MKLANFKLLATMTALTLGGSWAAPVFAQSADAGVSNSASERVSVRVDHANDIQAALDAMPAEGGEIIVPAGEFELDAPINMRGLSNVSIRGAGRKATGNNLGTTIHANFGSADQPVFDMVSAYNCELTDFSIRQTQHLGHDPACAILLGKDAQGFAGLNAFTRLRIYGRFEIAGVINLGSETNTWSRCSFMNLTGKPSYWSSSWNTMGVESPFGDLRGGSVMGGADAVRNVTQRFVDCAFGIPEDRNNPRRFEASYAIRIEPNQLAMRFDRCAFVAPEFSRAAILVVGDEGNSQGVDGLWLSQTQALDFRGQSIIECTGEAVFSQIKIEGQGIDGDRGRITLTHGATLGQSESSGDVIDFVEALELAWDDGVAIQLAGALSGSSQGPGMISGIATGSPALDSGVPETPEVVQASLTETEQNTNIEIVDIDPAATNDSESAQAAVAIEDESANSPEANTGAAPNPSSGVVGFQSSPSQAQATQEIDDAETRAAVGDDTGMPDVSFRDTPTQYVRGSNTPLRLNFSGDMPEGGDVLALAWSLDDAKLVDDFAHLIDADQSRVSTEHLNALLAGNYELQVLVRMDNTTVDRLTLPLSVSVPVVDEVPPAWPTMGFVDAPAQYEQGSGQAIQIQLSGELPEGADVLVLAWSGAEERMVGEFAFVLDEDNPQISAQQLDSLPAGATNLQLLLRDDEFMTKMRVGVDVNLIEAVESTPMGIAFATNAVGSITIGEAEAIAFEVTGDNADQYDLIVQARSSSDQALVDGFTYQAQASNGSIPASRLATLPEGEYVVQILLRHNNELVQQIDHALIVSVPVVVPDPPAPVDLVDPAVAFAPGAATSFQAGDSTTLAFNIVGDDMSDHDVVIQAWSASQNKLVGEFAYTAQAASGSIPASRLALLPAGDNYVQVILRSNFETVEIAEHRFTVVGDDTTTQQGTPDNEEEDVPVIDIDDPVSEDEGDPSGNGGGTTDENGDSNPDNNTDDNGSGNSSGDNGGGDASTDGAGHNWPVGAAGFTALPLVSDGRVIYVSASGNDSNDGRSPQTAVRTPQRGYQLLRNGRSDQLRFKAGDVFTSHIGEWKKSGRSADAPMVLGVYGDGARPRFEIGGKLFYHTDRDHDVDHLVIQGIHLHCVTRDPAHVRFDRNEADDAETGIYWSGTSHNILIEDCKFEYFAFGVVIQSPTVGEPRTPINPITGVTIRRNIFRYGWNRSHGQSSAIYTRYVHDLLIEDNLFDHNGWLPASWGVDGSERDDQSHHLYLTPRPGDERSKDFPAIIRGNILSRASSHGIKGSCGGVLENNLFAGNAIAGFMSGADSIIRRNVVLDSRDLAPDRPRGWGLEVFSMDQARIEDNIIAHRDSDKNRGWAFKMGASSNIFRGNIVHNWSVREHRDRDIEVYGELESQGNFLGEFTDNGGRYVDPDRSISSYHATLGGAASVDAFMDVAASRPRGAWDERYTQAAVNQYIRDGFQVIPFD